MDLLHSTHIVGNGSRAPAYRRLNLLRIEATVNPGRPTLAPPECQRACIRDASTEPHQTARMGMTLVLLLYLAGLWQKFSRSPTPPVALNES